MLSCATGAKEDRYTVVSDIPGGFLHEDIYDNDQIKFEETIEGNICKISPNNIDKANMVQ